jgi:virginiamycin A acetyltransferase
MNFVFGPYSYGEHPSDFGAWGMTGTITTGKFCSVGGGLKFMLNGNHRMEGFTSYPVHLLGCRFIKAFEKPIPKIGNDVWIGSNVTIYSGLDIGDGAVIGGNAVVAKSIPPYAVAVGNPARVVKYRFPPEIIEKLLKYKWWDFPIEHFKDRLVPLYEDINATVNEMEKIYYELHPEEIVLTQNLKPESV